MLVGIIADSHDNIPFLEKAVVYFNERKVNFVVHAGDFIAPFALLPMDKLRCPWIGVFGNNDGEKKGLTSLSKGRIQPAPYELNLDGKRVVVVHDLKTLDSNEFSKKDIDLVIYGHDHADKIEKNEKGVLYINPGELGGWLNGKHTIALVDTETLKANIISLDEE